jgi:hypothetical protein
MNKTKERKTVFLFLSTGAATFFRTTGANPIKNYGRNL